jgi:GH15 family glucan-1,4-alpha-glucosidase
MSSKFAHRPNQDGTVNSICLRWLVQHLAGSKRRREAIALFESLLDLRNDVGLLAEEYDPELRRFTGNFPQALSHISLINAARMLAMEP